MSDPVQEKAEKTPEEMAKLKAERDARKKQKELDKANKKGKGARMAEMKTQEVKQAAEIKDDPLQHLFGDMALNRSEGDPELRFTIKYVAVKDINAEHAGQMIRIRGRAHSVKSQKQAVFIVMREAFDTIQTIVFKPDTSAGMHQYAGQIPPESIIEIVAKAVVPDQEIKSATMQMELHIAEIRTVNKSVSNLPFQLADAMQRVENQEAEAEGVAVGGKKTIMVNQDVRLDNRVIDLRVPANQAIMRIQSGVCQLYREFMYEKDFVEIHSPKLLGGSSEGGANVFKLKYFGKDACLAQSPQLYKQMALCGDLQRVFEIGPVFRAENSFTNRHLCEFTGLDMEMEFKNHYFEVLDLIGELMPYIFNGLKTRFAKELSIVDSQYPFEEFVCTTPCLKLHFKEGIALLNEAGYKDKEGNGQDPLDDLSTESEKTLGALVKQKYGTDFYMLYGYPVAARPFYTMLDPVDPNYTNSYDFFMRGEEITSGAQRIHDPVLLAERAEAKGIPAESIQAYIDAFKYGAPNHAGAGFGLERIVKFFCNIHNIRKCSLFPRDPKRLTP